MASVAYSLQGPRFRATMGFLHASFSTAKFACQSYVLLLFALHFYGSCGDNAARFRRVFDARFLARFAAGPASRRNCARARRSLPARGQQGHCVRMWFIAICLFNSVFVSVGVDFRLVPPPSLHLCCRCREAVGFDPASPQKDEHIAICSCILASITALRPLSYRVTVATPLISNVFCEHVYMRVVFCCDFLIPEIVGDSCSPACFFYAQTQHNHTHCGAVCVPSASIYVSAEVSTYVFSRRGICVSTNRARSSCASGYCRLTVPSRAFRHRHH